jgi:hypothetical protein
LASRISGEALTTAGSGTIHFLLQLIRLHLNHVDLPFGQRIDEIGSGNSRDFCGAALGN